MNKPIFKKVVLGSVLVSTASTILFTSVSNYKVIKQSNNTSAYESIYKQNKNHKNPVNELSTSSVAFMSQSASAETSTTSYQNVNPATTQVVQTPQSNLQSLAVPATTTGIPMPTFSSSVKSPSGPNMHDGEITFTLSKEFDPQTMEAEGAISVLGSYFSYNNANRTVKVIGLGVGESAQIQVKFNKTSTKLL